MKEIPEDVIEDFLQFILKQKNEASVKSYIAIKNALNIFSIPYPIVTLQKGKRLFRCRLHQKNEEFFLKDTDLSNRLDVNRIIEFGRANEPLQSIFYCSDNLRVARLETSKVVRDQSDLDEETITIGVWEVLEDIRIGHIISNHTIKGLNKTVDGLQDNFEEIVEKLRNDKTDLNLKVLDLFSQEFTRDAQGNPNNYLISSAYANYIFENYGFDTHFQQDIFPSGIIYPSVIWRTDGVNIALKSEIFETEKIKLIDAVRVTMKKVKEKEYKDDVVIKSKRINPDNGEIFW